MSDEQTFASVWDAIEDTPAEAENMKLRSALMITFTCSWSIRPRSQFRTWSIASKACPAVCCAKSDQTSRKDTGRACCGLHPISHHLAVAHPSPSYANTSSNSRHPTETTSHYKFALSFLDLNDEALRASGNCRSGLMRRNNRASPFVGKNDVPNFKRLVLNFAYQNGNY